MLDRYSRADQLCAATAALAALAMFLPWFSSTGDGITVTVNGFRSGMFGDLVFVAAAAMVLLLLIRHGAIRTGLDRDLPEGQLLLAAGAAAVAAAIVQIVVGNGGDHMPAPGLLLALAATIGMAAGGWIQYQDDTSPSRSLGRHSGRRR
jgi:peptidoglycan/LPS O-acetylase OafA/YrhL